MKMHGNNLSRYVVVYSDDSLKDIEHLSQAIKKRIQNAIYTKLVSNPVIFGKPLRHSLKGIRALRVGNYRITYILRRKEVYSILIGHRSTVYKRVDTK